MTITTVDSVEFFSGYTRLFQLNDSSNTWEELFIIEEPIENHRLGWCINLSDDGNTLAVLYNNISSEGYGYVTIYKDSTTSTKDDKEKPGFRLYPNPVHNNLHIDGLSSDLQSLQISDVLGQNSFTAKYRNGIVDVSGLIPGTYYIQGMFNNTLTTLGRFIKI